MAIAIDPKSVASLCLIPYALSQPLATGTGFVVAIDGINLLITNYHVATGRHPETDEQMPGVVALPDRILIPLLRSTGEELNWLAHVQLLRKDDIPLWIEHPIWGHRFDVVAIPLAVPKSALILPYARDPGVNIAVPLGSEVFVIGFPEGLSAAGLTALWKGGSLASEPELTIEKENFFWIDSNTRRGMSGAPVIARRFGGALMADGPYAVGQGISDRILGVYAGRAFDAPDMTLGRVWGWTGVQQLIDFAVSRVRRGLLSPVPCTIGYFEAQGKPMTSIDITRKVEIVYANASGVVQTHITDVAELLIGFVLNDHRFGQSLVRLKLSAGIAAAVEAAKSGDGMCKLDDAQYALIRQAVEEPLGQQYGPIGRQLLPLIEYILEAGKQ